MASSRRRLIIDQSSLHKAPLPPNYLFPEDGAAMPDDLSQLTILLAGANGTPYSQGLWRVHLKMPEDYPKAPPKATFRTRIFHPNVEESTGTVCVETLKRDWDSKLTLRDVLITISCLLIQPNPDSALNATAGSLLQEDYEAFARQAKLMTSIHAPIPSNLRPAVQEAKLRGEDAGITVPQTEPDSRPQTSRASSSKSSVIFKKAVNNSANQVAAQSQPEDENDEEEYHDPAKENDPSLSPSPVTTPDPLSPRRTALGKRPLSALPTPIDPDDESTNISASERNLSQKSISLTSNKEASEAGQPLRKSPKLLIDKGANASGRIREGIASESKVVYIAEDEKENLGKDRSDGRLSDAELSSDVTSKAKQVVDSTTREPSMARPTLRKVSTASSSGSGKGAKARVGIRRL